jgi:hypothetical protein
LAHVLQVVQARSIGAMQYGQTGPIGWAREQNGHTTESSSTSFPQNRQGFL